MQTLSTKANPMIVYTSNTCNLNSLNGVQVLEKIFGREDGDFMILNETGFREGDNSFKVYMV